MYIADNGKTSLRIFLTVLLVYLFYIAPDYLNANTNRYIDLTKSIVEDKTFSIDRYYQNTRDWALYKGHYYIGAAPGLSLAAVPVYVASRPLLRLIPPSVYSKIEYDILNLFFAFFLAVLPGAFIAVLLYAILKKFNPNVKERMLIVFASSFGTITFYYSTRFMAHTLGAFLLFSAFYVLFTYKEMDTPGKRYPFFLAGLCLGLAALTEYTLIIGSALLLAYALFNFRRYRIWHYMLLFIGLAIMASFSMYYHYRCFDNPFAVATRYSPLIGPIPLAYPKPKIMFELTFGTYKGIFTYMPVTLISVYGVIAFFMRPEKKHLPEMVLITVFSVLIFLAISLVSNIMWPWGGDFGPRYFVSFLPFLMVPISYAFKRLGYRTVFWVTALSAFINWCGVQYGDTDNAFVNSGIFILKGLNSSLAQWAYSIVNANIRKFNVITHFSAFVPFVVLLIFLYMIWRKEIKRYLYEVIGRDTGL